MDNLRANACDVEPGTRIAEIDEKKKAKYLLDVEYSCCHWMNHLYKSNSKQGDDGLLHIFLTKHFLHWLEVMSLTKQVPESIIVMNDLKSYTSHVENSELYRFIHDAEQFISFNRSGIEQAPLQIYSSALFLAPKKNIIRQTFKRCIPPWLYEITRKRSSWTPGIQILEGHTSFIHDIVFSPNRKMVASGSWDHQIRLYDTATGRLLQVYHPASDIASHAAFSSDSRMIASGLDDGTIRIWDTLTGELLHVFEGHSDTVTSIIFSLDDKMIISCSRDATVRLWTMDSNHSSELLFGPGSHSSGLYALLISPDNKMIAGLLEHDEICLCNTDEKLFRLFNNNAGNEDSFFGSIILSPNSKLLASIHHKTEIRVCGTEVGRKLLWVHEYHQLIGSIVFSPNSQMIALAVLKSVQLWDARKGVLLQTFNGHFYHVMDISFSPNGQMMASASQDRTIRLWYISGQLVKILKGHLFAVTKILFSPDSKMIASSSPDKTVRLWDIETLIAIPLSNIQGNSIKDGIRCLKFSSNGRMLAIDYVYLKDVLLQDVETGEVRQRLVNACLDDNARLPIQFSPNNKIIAIAAGNGRTTELWDAAEGKLLHELDNDGENINRIIFSLDSTMVLCDDDDKCQSKLWNSRTGKFLKKLPSCVNKKHWYLAAFSPDGKVLAFGFDHETQLWSTKTGKLLRKMDNHPSSTSSRGRFARLPTLKRSYNLSYSNDWIVEKTFNGERNILWLPFEYRPSCMASRRGIIAMGYRSGKIFRMKIGNDDNEVFAKDIGVWGGELDTGEDEEIDDYGKEMDGLSDQMWNQILSRSSSKVMGHCEDSTEDPCVWEGTIDSDAESSEKGASERFSGGEQLQRQLSEERLMKEEEIDDEEIQNEELENKENEKEVIENEETENDEKRVSQRRRTEIKPSHRELTYILSLRTSIEWSAQVQMTFISLGLASSLGTACGPKFFRNVFDQKIINAWRIDELCAVEEGEGAETRSRLRLTSNPATTDRASPIPTEEVMYPYCGFIDAGPIEWESMGGRVQEFDRSQLLEADVENTRRKDYTFSKIHKKRTRYNATCMMTRFSDLVHCLSFLIPIPRKTRTTLLFSELTTSSHQQL
ncbi:hypothetical protein BOTCAL_0112g00280 [Botryotinia calthae]|uniref:Uncharacterized protein n=1 Tax=Botryotinia calthae TaxID=38488 RepID=A0A4Y8D7U3_9HELO|nr:hypothetical protein BOTCAL_0112g00280 [Botryotinia calthae]